MQRDDLHLTYTIRGFTYTVLAYPDLRRDDKPYGGYRTQARVYVDLSKTVEKIWGIGGDVDHTPCKDRTLEDARWEAYNSIELTAMSFHLRPILQRLLQGRRDPDVGFTFSRRAGCNCGCSPGYLLRAVTTGQLARHLNTINTVKNARYMGGHKLQSSHRVWALHIDVDVAPTYASLLTDVQRKRAFNKWFRRADAEYRLGRMMDAGFDGGEWSGPSHDDTHERRMMAAMKQLELLEDPRVLQYVLEDDAI